MKQNSLIVIYGAGQYGTDLLRLLNNLDISVDYFVQSKVKQYFEIENIPVVSWDKLLEAHRINVLFAIRDRSVLNSIRNNLFQEARNDVIVYDCIEFIESNCYVKNVVSCQGEKECLICGNTFSQFGDGGVNTELFIQHHIIGGGYRKNCVCPVCRSTDRERWLYYNILHKIKIDSLNGRILHFAPERNISNLLKNSSCIDYYTGDIVKGRAMHITDITNLQYADKSMDCIICNHVLEHIVDIQRAVSEIKRVLTDDGIFIFSFPICTDMPTVEDLSITTEEERLKYYGQKDHVRLYGNDFVDIYESYGFVLELCIPKEMITKEEIEKYGFIEDDVIVIAKKRKDE